MEGSIKNIFLGLPTHLVNRVLMVARKYRTNPLSFNPGGSDVVVEYHDGSVLGYDWIKFPSDYISTIFTKSLISEYDNFESSSEVAQLEIVKSKYYRIYARKYENENESKTVPFQEVWNSESAKTLPWEVLKEFDAYKKNHSKPIYNNLSQYKKVNNSKDSNLPRLSKIARELNVGITTLVDFLYKQGFKISTDPNKKIDAEAHELLKKQFRKNPSI